MSFTVEDIQKHQQELETHLQELVETMEKQKEQEKLMLFMAP